MFDETGTRIYPIVRIKQYRFEGECPCACACMIHLLQLTLILVVIGDSLIRKDIAFVEEQEDGSLSFSFLEGINDSVIYPSKLVC